MPWALHIAQKLVLIQLDVGKVLPLLRAFVFQQRGKRFDLLQFALSFILRRTRGKTRRRPKRFDSSLHSCGGKRGKRRMRSACPSPKIRPRVRIHRPAAARISCTMRQMPMRHIHAFARLFHTQTSIGQSFPVQTVPISLTASCRCVTNGYSSFDLTLCHPAASHTPREVSPEGRNFWCVTNAHPSFDLTLCHTQYSTQSLQMQTISFLTVTKI